MNRILKSILTAGLLLLGCTASCNLAAQPPKATTPPTQTRISRSTEALLDTPTAEFAPLCPSEMAPTISTAQCQSPTINEVDKFCVEKRPYNLIAINSGSTYELLTDGFTCKYEGTKESKQMISCTGMKSRTFEIGVCNSVCAILTAQVSFIKCQQGYTYNEANNCCAQQVQQSQQNCISMKFDTPRCILHCRDYDMVECINRSYGCVWQEGRCEPRK